MCERSPDRREAPRMWLGATAMGTVIRVRHDVEDHVAALLDATRIECELTFVLADVAAPPQEAPVVMSGTPDGDGLLAQLESEGMPSGLAGMGFAGTGDLWEPWCAALDGEAVVSVAFAARLSVDGAEVGVATAPAMRGRGLAAAVTAAWAGHPALAGRARFYTTAAGNTSSRRVADRLGLRLLGPSIAVA